MQAMQSQKVILKAVIEHGAEGQGTLHLNPIAFFRKLNKLGKGSQLFSRHATCSAIERDAFHFSACCLPSPQDVSNVLQSLCIYSLSEKS